MGKKVSITEDNMQEFMKLSNLKLSDYNPRKISEKQLKMLKKSLEKFGDLSGIIYNRRTGNVVGGHQRIKCLPSDAKIEKINLQEKTKTGTVAYGWVLIDGEKFIYREVDWDEATEKMANIAANKHGGEFDNDALAPILKELSELPDFNIALIGFESSEFHEILSQIEGVGLIDDDEVPIVDLPEPHTKYGDVYVLGKHRILCGDSTKKEDVEKLMCGERADLVITDPPYNIGFSYNQHKDKMKPEEYKEFCKSFFELLDSDKIIITPGPKNLPIWYEITNIRDIGWLKIEDEVNGVEEIIFDEGVWVKKNSRSGASCFHFRLCEPIIFYGKFNKKRTFDLFEYKREIKKELIDAQKKGNLESKYAPAKPVALIVDLIKSFSEPGELIKDVFLGSGTTLIACEKTNRICYGIEKDPHYCDVIVERWCQYTGQRDIIKNGEHIRWEIKHGK